MASCVYASPVLVSVPLGEELDLSPQTATELERVIVKHPAQLSNSEITLDWVKP